MRRRDLLKTAAAATLTASVAPREQQRPICVDLQKQLWTDVPFIPMGEYWQATAYRKDLTDVLPGCFATFYGVRRA
jgi:hypothetical protein